MRTPRELEPLLPILRAVQKLLNRFESKGIIIGGVAVSLLAQARLTADVDAVILLSANDLPSLLRAAKAEGFEPRIREVAEFARRNRVVLLRHRQSGADVDISLGALPLEIEAIERSQWVHVGKLRLKIPTVEDLIIMKAIAHRPKDLLDIQSLTEANPKLDRERVRRWVKEFAQLLEMPELWSDIAKWIER